MAIGEWRVGNDGLEGRASAWPKNSARWRKVFEHSHVSFSSGL